MLIIQTKMVTRLTHQQNKQKLYRVQIPPKIQSTGQLLATQCVSRRFANPVQLVRLLNGEFSDERSTYFIIDCRFLYEFEGGHIRGATNISTTEDIERFFIESEKYKEYD